MKKALSLLLGLVICFSLCACGGNDVQTPEDKEPESTTQATNSSNSAEENETPENKQISLHLNETATWGDFELTIIDVRLKDADGFSVNYTTGGRHYGGPCVVVTYSLKNIGKYACIPPQGMFQLTYGDGYTFIPDLYINGKHPNIFANGGTNSANELPVLSSEQYYLEAFTVPQEVLANSDEPLFITLIGANSVEDSMFRFDIRPIDDIQTEALYEQAISLMDEKRYNSACENLMMIQTQKDVDDLLLECWLKSSDGYEYLEEIKDDFKVWTGDEIKLGLIGTWENRQGETWVFSEDGTVDKGENKVIGHQGERIIDNWSLEGDILIIGNEFITEKYVVKQPYEGALILCYAESKLDYQGNDVIGKIATSMWESE